MVRQLSERLVRAGHHVTVATSRLPERDTKELNGVRIQEFDVSGSAAFGLDGNWQEYENWLLNSRFDIVTNFAAQQWATDVALPVLARIPAKKVFVPTGFSGLYRPEFKEYFAKMAHWMRQYDMSVFLSDEYRDINFARQHGISKLTLIPNGAGEDEFLAPLDIDIRKQLGIAPNQFLVLHVGSYTGEKGHRETVEIFEEANLRNAVLLMVGNDNVRFRKSLKKYSLRKRLVNRVMNRRVIIATLTRPETVAAYQAADLFLFPSNIECSPIVLFECMAARTPFLTTDVGNAAEIISWSGGGVLLPTRKDDNGYSHAAIDASAHLLKRVRQDTSVRKSMASAGFKAWQEKFSWEKITAQYEHLYFNLMQHDTQPNP